MSVEPSVPLPLEPSPPPQADDKRLWIGNIDSRLSEYNLLKLLQHFGQIKKFDFLFHKSGILKGQPRGYCFVTYETKEQAEKALLTLNGKLVLDKYLVIKWAHTVPMDTQVPKKQSPAPPSISLEENKQSKNVHHQISAIEAKLKAMEEQNDTELEFCLSPISKVSENKTFSLPSRRMQDAPYIKYEKKTFVKKY